MNQTFDLKAKIVSTKKTLPKKQQKLCDYILKHFEDLGLVTIKELAKDAEVGISTVMRTIHALDYDNFNDFRRDIYNSALPNDSKFSLKNAFIESGKVKSHTLTHVWDKSVSLLNQSLKPDLISSFDQAINLIEQANNIYVLGTRPYKTTALYLEHLLNEFNLSIQQLSYDTDAIFDKTKKMTNSDLLIAFSFEPYTYSVINAVKETKQQGNDIILITDHDTSPLIEFSNVTLKLSVRKDHFSILPIIALIDAIVLELGKRTSETSLKHLEKLEEVLNRNHVTYNTSNS
ncbi:MurR/RpiR family transcriptional regulator [Staphylococcus gallinarum]|uniref:MurR/RpiR family transcriptional regulator n=1 Tax=Staphylococcus gallinarum TaxID=1293 RepID=UPI000D1EAFA1|nr:MurR/RpiR family transcriptional regulator [Staphylococcus gallinarum]MCD8821803.1 MurR/RpiR family transcriptional regulator [Staphylococcus gallinarum]PTL07141.1 MurR/RpiR family transcriptional regulator [Staphylococcus gallinarum]PTL09120.1 MurR/RpiR family transcriptional regulator [Staphylococcus gallinarum]RIL31543.1 MurR/RpiR family transcriptional regulator [Staphylococcus gallinarum]RIO75979.1 MurR/RpiR family transcriptional regulator [Staphylococcus gallinarum]